MNKFINFLSITLLTISSIVLIALQMKFIGWIILLAGAAITLLFTKKVFKKDIILLYISTALLGIAPISTNIEPESAVPFGLFIILAVITPYLISHYVYKDDSLQFSFHHGRNWYKKEFLYFFWTASVAYLVLPYLLRVTGSYQHWFVTSDPSYLLKFFIGINLVGLWDELFFISTILGVLRKHIPFFAANIAQSVMFTAFLYELGFRGALFIIIFGFAILQGYVFKRTESLFYLVTIHLAADVILYLALVHAHYPNLMPIFLIK